MSKGRESTSSEQEQQPLNLFDMSELDFHAAGISLYRDLIVEFVLSFLFLILCFTMVGSTQEGDKTKTVDMISLPVGVTIFIPMYRIAGVLGGGNVIGPPVTFGLLVARKMTLVRAILYVVAQCLGAIVGVGLVKLFMKDAYHHLQGGAKYVHAGSKEWATLEVEIIAAFVFLLSVLVAIDPEKRACNIQATMHLLASSFIVQITGTAVNPARSLAVAIFLNNRKVWDNMWIFWVGPFLGAGVAAIFHDYILRACPNNEGPAQEVNNNVELQNTAVGGLTGGGEVAIAITE